MMRSWKYGIRKFVSVLKPKKAKYLVQLMSIGDIIPEDLDSVQS